MTEAEWLAATDPTPMLEFLKGKASDRKLRLTLCAIGRLWPDIDVREEDVASLQVAEKYADGELSLNEVNAVRNKQKRVQFRHLHGPVLIRWSSQLLCPRKMLVQSCFELCARTLRARIVEITDDPTWERDRRQRHDLFGRERPAFAALLRDIFGPLPLCPATITPTWLTSTVVSLAHGIYADRAFDRLPILADALQDAGCENADILTHCRSDGPHVRGCWVVDLVLGKE
jgi:hypothetical protein